MAAEDPTHDFDPQLGEIRPVAPFERGSEKALKRIFDRNSETLEPVPSDILRTVSDVLRDYHRQPEYKFLGGGWNEEGVLRRRHVLQISRFNEGKTNPSLLIEGTFDPNYFSGVGVDE